MYIQHCFTSEDQAHKGMLHISSCYNTSEDQRAPLTHLCPNIANKTDTHHLYHEQPRLSLITPDARPDSATFRNGPDIPLCEYNT
jgi:hypothetical protein